MIFSDKIYKINSGTNVSLYAKDNNTLLLYLFDKTLKSYDILINSDKKCVFSNIYEYKKIIKLNQNHIGPCSNSFITLCQESEL